MNRVSFPSLAVLAMINLLPNAEAQEAVRQLRPAVPPSIVWVNEPKPNQTIPERVTHKTWQSETVNQEVGYNIYLPPQYDADSDARFPVIYNLHGNGGNEFTTLASAKMLHGGIIEGKWPPMIMVFPNGGHSTFYKDSHDGKFPIETMFIKEFIPYIDENYRTIADRSGRCIEGFSMGGRGSTRLAIKYPELFCSLFCQAGNVPHLLDDYDPGQPESYPNAMYGPERSVYEANDVYHLIETKAAKLRKDLRILVACGTRDGGHLPTIRDFHQALLDSKVDHTYIELEGLAHKRDQFLELIGELGFRYHAESIRLAQEG